MIAFQPALIPISRLTRRPAAGGARFEDCERNSPAAGQFSRLKAALRARLPVPGPHQSWISAAFLAVMRPMHTFPRQRQLYLEGEFADFPKTGGWGRRENDEGPSPADRGRVVRRKQWTTQFQNKTFSTRCTRSNRATCRARPSARCSRGRCSSWSRAGMKCGSIGRAVGHTARTSTG